MKRFASHYLYLAGCGFFRQYLVEVNDKGCVSYLSPLEAEAESVIWLPGVIALVPRHLLREERGEGADVNKRYGIIHSFFESGIIEKKQELPEAYKNNIAQLGFSAVRLYPFDFTAMQPTSETLVHVLDQYAF